MLRIKVMLGLGSLLVILLAMGIYSVDRCSELGHRIEAISRDNDQMGRNLVQLKHAGAGMTSALLFRVTGQADHGRKQFEESQSMFEQALLEIQGRDKMGKEEKELTARIQSAYKTYVTKARSLLNSGDGEGPALKAPASQLGDEVVVLLDLIDQLSAAHQKGITDSGRDSGSDLNSTIRSLWLLMLVALVVAFMASVSLSRGLLNPLTALSKSIQEVGEGNLDQTVPVLSRDELGQLATSFNQMAAQLKVYRSNTSVELTRLNQTIRATLASFPDPIFVLDAQGAVNFRNPEADQLALKLLFSGVTRLPLKVDERVEHVRATGQDYLPTLFKDAIKFHLDGQDRYFLPRIVVLRDDKRKAFGVAVILEDITRMLLLDDVKSNLISTVSHELKTPLTSVRMALYLLVEKTVGPLNEKQADLVLTAREDADRLLRTLNDLLDLAKLEQGPAQLQLVRVSPAKLVESSVQSMREFAQASHIQVNTEISDNLPEVEIDRQRIAYVFSNLITNAVKYSPEGSLVQVKAALGQTRADRPSVRFSVKDQGEGISPEHQIHIFERFYRVPGTRKSGAGLGLSIAREIVVAHGGEMGVISVPGEGSEFFFVLPFASVEKPPSSADEKADRHSSGVMQGA